MRSTEQKKQPHKPEEGRSEGVAWDGTKADIFVCVCVCIKYRQQMDRGAWQAIVHRVTQFDMTEAT